MRAKAALYLKRVGDMLGGSPIRVGYLLTGVWVVLLAIYVMLGKGWIELWRSGFSEIGDFLSGAFAPLAFFWLVIAVLLQTHELSLQREQLRESTEALKEQAKEAHALVEQNKRSVDVATKTLVQQELRAREDRVHRVIDALAFKIMNLASHSYVVVNGNRSEPFSNQRTLRKQAEEDGSRDAVFPFVLKQIVNWLFYVSDQKQQPPVLAPSPTLIEDVQMLLERFRELNTVLANEHGLETVRVRAYALDLEAYVDALEDVLSVLGHSNPSA